MNTFIFHTVKRQGAGGIFFDDLVIGDFSTTLNFCKDVLKFLQIRIFQYQKKKRSASQSLRNNFKITEEEDMLNLI